MLKRIDIWFPAEFQWLDPECQVMQGLGNRTDTYTPISCVTDCGSETCDKLITITNFDDYLTGDFIEVKVGAMTPDSAGTTSKFLYRAYSDAEDTSTIQEENNVDIDVVISDVDYPHEF